MQRGVIGSISPTLSRIKAHTLARAISRVFIFRDSHLRMRVFLVYDRY